MPVTVLVALLSSGMPVNVIAGNVIGAVDPPPRDCPVWTMPESHADGCVFTSCTAGKMWSNCQVSTGAIVETPAASVDSAVVLIDFGIAADQNVGD